MKRQLVFFLGGRDLEMQTIRELLEQEGAAFYDKQLSWGAAASAYRQELDAVQAAGKTAVLVELALDVPLDPARRLVVVDHHGDAAGRQTSLEQVFALLELAHTRWSRWYDLVAANDAGHIDGLLRAGATCEEVARVRAADRAAQGITAEEEAQGAAAAAAAERPHPALTVARLPHARTATVADRLHRAAGGPGYENLLIFSPGEVNFYGEGDLIEALDRAFPGGWKGGELPRRGYWGRAGDTAPVYDHLLRLLAHRVEARDGR